MALANDHETQLVHAYLDGELDVASALRIEARIAADPALRELAAEISALKAALAEKLPPEPAPARLRGRIATSLGLERMGPARIARSSRWMLMAASLVAVAGLSSLLTVAGLRELAPDTISAELVDGHLRSLMAAQMTDVVSSDKHTVKPWFNGRITQSPRIVDLARQGFDLVGARVDVVDRMPVPTLVYRRRQHVISLTELAGEGRTGLSLRRGAEHGFNVVAWRDGNRSFVAISDLNATELEAFATSFQTAAE